MHEKIRKASTIVDLLQIRTSFFSIAYKCFVPALWIRAAVGEFTTNLPLASYKYWRFDKDSDSSSIPIMVVGDLAKKIFRTSRCVNPTFLISILTHAKLSQATLSSFTVYTSQKPPHTSFYRRAEGHLYTL